VIYIENLLSYRQLISIFHILTPFDSLTLPPVVNDILFHLPKFIHCNNISPLDEIFHELGVNFAYFYNLQPPEYFKLPLFEIGIIFFDLVHSHSIQFPLNQIELVLGLFLFFYFKST
jgi:hypothetical protein